MIKSVFNYPVSTLLDIEAGGGDLPIRLWRQGV